MTGVILYLYGILFGCFQNLKDDYDRIFINSSDNFSFLFFGMARIIYRPKNEIAIDEERDLLEFPLRQKNKKKKEVMVPTRVELATLALSFKLLAPRSNQLGILLV